LDIIIKRFNGILDLVFGRRTVLGVNKLLRCWTLCLFDEILACYSAVFIGVREIRDRVVEVVETAGAESAIRFMPVYATDQSLIRIG